MNHLKIKNKIKQKGNTLSFIQKIDHSIFRKAILIREVQKKIIKEYRIKELMKCPIHLCIGQEMPSGVYIYQLSTNNTISSKRMTLLR